MEDLNKKADELFNLMYDATDRLGKYPMCYDTAIQCAIQSVNYTIEVLGKVRDDISDFWYKGNVIVAINEQIELKKILEGRL